VKGLIVPSPFIELKDSNSAPIVQSNPSAKIGGLEVQIWPLCLVYLAPSF